MLNNREQARPHTICSTVICSTVIHRYCMDFLLASVCDVNKNTLTSSNDAVLWSDHCQAILQWLQKIENT